MYINYNEHNMQIRRHRYLLIILFRYQNNTKIIIIIDTTKYPNEKPRIYKTITYHSTKIWL